MKKKILKAATRFAKHAQRVGLIDDEIGAPFTLHLRKFTQRSSVSQHRIDAFDDDDLVAWNIGQTAQSLVQIVRIVVTKTGDLRMAEPRAIVNACVGICIEKQVIVLSGER